MSSRPAFDDLPLRKDGPPGNAWGLFGDNDELGQLNLLTPENTAQAAREIQDGGRVSVNLELGHLKAPCFGRKPLEHKIWRKGDRVVHDDALSFNTQSSSQWDGFRHFGSHSHERFYNGATFEEIAKSDKIGIHAWVDHGGVVGRGVLLDYAAWADAQGLKPEIFEPTTITVATLEEIAKSQGTTLRKGDIIFIRSGYLRAYDQISSEKRQELADAAVPPAIGLESSEATLRWIWEKQPAAMVGDHPSMEAWPCQDPKHSLHEWLLAGWGLPIGELFDLEKLGEECKKRNRWTFFFSSMPLKVMGGAASPPNGVAIF